MKNDENSEDEIDTFRHSPYYDTDGLNEILCSKTDEFSVLSINIQSINAKFDKFLVLLNELHDNINFQFSAICIQETWLTEEHDLSLLQIPGYNLIHQGKLCSAHGGLIIYLKEMFSFSVRAPPADATVYEGLFIDINHDSLKNKITLCNIYRPPKNNNNNATVDTFINEIRPVIETFNKDSPNLLITGDFNLNLLAINERTKFQEYFDLFVTNALYPKITLPTRFSSKSATLIDQIFCKHNQHTQSSTSGIILTQISDHLPYFTCIDAHRRNNLTPKYQSI